MRYQNKEGKRYLVYCINMTKDKWKIEEVPFTGHVMEVTGTYVDEFIKSKGLIEVVEPWIPWD